MSGCNTGILINAYPITAEQIAEIEAKIFTVSGNTYAFLTDTCELCYAFNYGVDSIKQHAWHQAWELSIEDGVYVKRIYKKKSRIEYYLWKTLYKNSLEEAWRSLEPELPQIEPPAVIVLDGNTLNIFDESGLATSATVYVDGEAKETIEIARGYTVTVTVEDVPEQFYITVNSGEVNDTLGFETDKLTATYENVHSLLISSGMPVDVNSCTNGTYEQITTSEVLFTPTGDNATVSVGV